MEFLKYFGFGKEENVEKSPDEKRILALEDKSKLIRQLRDAEFEVSRKIDPIFNKEISPEDKSRFNAQIASYEARVDANVSEIQKEGLSIAVDYLMKISTDDVSQWKKVKSFGLPPLKGVEWMMDAGPFSFRMEITTEEIGESPFYRIGGPSGGITHGPLPEFRSFQATFYVIPKSLVGKNKLDIDWVPRVRVVENIDPKDSSKTWIDALVPMVTLGVRPATLDAGLLDKAKDKILVLAKKIKGLKSA